MKYASISTSPVANSTNNTPVRKLFNETSNQQSSSRDNAHSNNSSNSNNVAIYEDSGHDLLTHRALLKNELLKHSIIDIRVCFFREFMLELFHNSTNIYVLFSIDSLNE